MESAYCAGFKEIGDDIEPRAPRSPFEPDPELADGKVWSGIHELRKSAQLPNQLGFGVGEPPKDGDLKKRKDQLQRAMSSHDGGDEGADPVTPGRLPGMGGGDSEPGAAGNTTPTMPATIEKQEVKLHERRGFLGAEADLFANLEQLPDLNTQGGYHGGSGVALSPGDEVQAEPAPDTASTINASSAFAPFVQGQTLVEEVHAYIQMYSLSLETVAQEARVPVTMISQWLSLSLTNGEPDATVNLRYPPPPPNDLCSHALCACR